MESVQPIRAGLGAAIASKRDYPTINRLAIYQHSRMSAEVYASLDSMEGIELPRPVVARETPPKTPPKTPAWRSHGLLAAIGVAAVAWGLHLLLPALSSAILAIVLGALVRNTMPLPASLVDDCKGLVKRVIPVTIILTGASANLTEVARVGAPSLVVIVASILCGCVAAVVAGRLTRTSRHTAMLVGCGTAIRRYERDHRGRADPWSRRRRSAALGFHHQHHGIAGDVFAAGLLARTCTRILWLSASGPG